MTNSRITEFISPCISVDMGSASPVVLRAGEAKLLKREEFDVLADKTYWTLYIVTDVLINGSTVVSGIYQGEKPIYERDGGIFALYPAGYVPYAPLGAERYSTSDGRIYCVPSDR